MTLKIDPGKVQLLEKKIREFCNSGLSLEEGLLQIHAETGTLANLVGIAASCSSSTENVLIYNSAEMASAIMTINPSFTPLEIAILTKKLFGNPEDVVEAVLGAFPAFTATEMGQLLINAELYPNMSFEEMNLALKAGEYSESEITIALTEIYGAPAKPVEVNFYEPTITLTNASVQTGPGSVYNSSYQRSWRMLYPGSSFIQVDFNHVKTGFSTVNLVMVHLTSMTGGHNGYSPIDILINGQVFKSKYDVVNGNYQQDTFDITSFVAEGNNTIRLNFCSGAITHYWIQNLKVNYVK